MSLLFVDQSESSALLVADTLVTHGDEPFMFRPKVTPFPHHNMVMASMGSSNLGAAWRQWILSTPGLTDIDSINEFAPAELRRLNAELETRFGEIGTSTIYHYGFPAGSDRLVSYVYRSGSDFEPDRFVGNRFTAKPLPAGSKFERPSNNQEVVALAVRVRDLNNEQLHDGGWGVRIGGDLFATLIENWTIQTARWHRFDDYAQRAEAIAKGTTIRMLTETRSDHS
jgi:hypothetical protein